MELQPVVLIGGVYREETEADEDEEMTIDGGGGGSGGGGGWGGGFDVERDGADEAPAIDTTPDENKGLLDEIIVLAVAASLYLYFIISVLIAFSSACKDCTCCCKLEIAPKQP